jgi:hypothetical protein
MFRSLARILQRSLTRVDYAARLDELDNVTAMDEPG